ncbi:MAG: hypothetical protein A3F18_00135 [Legionellales bacterium RIFCSPHIGHO2_12_FULL_37_14]|nr:MAG: hypothetical protein A3F18_00135 [Legionellales bacterium RIFCSPHIGHO2_12_FULL_37_14]
MFSGQQLDPAEFNTTQNLGTFTMNSPPANVANSSASKDTVFNIKIASSMLNSAHTSTAAEVYKSLAKSLAKQPAWKVPGYLVQFGSIFIVLNNEKVSPRLKFGYIIIATYCVIQTIGSLYLYYTHSDCENAEDPFCLTYNFLDYAYQAITLMLSMGSGAAVANEKRLENKRKAAVASSLVQNSQPNSLDGQDATLATRRSANRQQLRHASSLPTMQQSRECSLTRHPVIPSQDTIPVGNESFTSIGNENIASMPPQHPTRLRFNTNSAPTIQVPQDPRFRSLATYQFRRNHNGGPFSPSSTPSEVIVQGIPNQNQTATNPDMSHVSIHMHTNSSRSNSPRSPLGTHSVFRQADAHEDNNVIPNANQAPSR